MFKVTSIPLLVDPLLAFFKLYLSILVHTWTFWKVICFGPAYIRAESGVYYHNISLVPSNERYMHST